ncbi:HAD family hydrolase [Chroococcidiopsis sp. CCALA 051]|uniref:HAD family hydrolase n=1 Tax=Chroococcidiopsis sp. CCALA 051 TaxID=869949 RepID=UPI000D0DE111|nr:HAD family hydrolase [Chroococcidiopsis sp. CCALA 051]MBE9015935.1 HAD family hydrolase [Chroococcidiopsidales cyanobacterium LEGE 13417]PSM48513.1 HAD family hydrolase [Chroococcidiopsis sp. CCALA 051]
MLKAIVFDLDDTLFPEHEFVCSGFQAVSSWLEAKYAVTGFFEVAWHLFKIGQRNNIFNLTLEQLKLEYEIGLIQELVHLYRQHKPIIFLYEDARWAIDYFNEDFQLGIITDGYLTTQRNKVTALGIESIFEAIVYSDLYGRENWKPSPLPYQKIMRSLGCIGEECMYIGDNPQKDFVTAKKLGWIAVQICRMDGEYAKILPKENYDADFQISSLFNLKDIITKC